MVVAAAFIVAGLSTHVKILATGLRSGRQKLPRRKSSAPVVGVGVVPPSGASAIPARSFILAGSLSLGSAWESAILRVRLPDIIRIFLLRQKTRRRALDDLTGADSTGLYKATL
jgi:hypothetical protein